MTKKSTGESASADRNQKGQFTKGNPGGPGRPKKEGGSIPIAELRKLAVSMEPNVPFLIAREFDELLDTLKAIESGDTYSDEAKQQVRLQIDNRRLAALALNAKLRAEIRKLTS